jgi:hypothetical protein
MTGAALDAESLADGALRWVLGCTRVQGDGVDWPQAPGDDEQDPTLYSGAAGIVLALLEAHAHFGDDRYADTVLAASRALAAAVDDWQPSGLYLGVTGIALALHAVGERLGEAAATAAAVRALDLVRARFDGERWGEQFELLGGNAGIALGALAAGAPDLALLAVEPYLRRAEPTAAGVQWEVRSRMPARFHHISHGTLGIVSALAATGEAVGRADLLELALAGAADVVARNEAGDEGFLVPHSDPMHRPDVVERYSYGWCHGPAGDAQTFRLLGRVTGQARWGELVERCWQTVTSCGLPARLRPGFWDNNGRCCGTAGVLALALDRSSAGAGDLAFAGVLRDDLAAQATVDEAGVRWSNVEHRSSPSRCAAQGGWAMGNAGIVRELLRLARAEAGGDRRYVVPMPDQPMVDLPPGRRSRSSAARVVSP